MKNACLIVLLVAGCAKTESDDILTSGIHAEISAVSDGNETTVKATLFLGQPSQLIFVELSGDDELIAHRGTVSKVMTETELLNVVAYHATFPGGSENDELEIEFRRAIDQGAPSSTCTLPGDFVIGLLPGTNSRAASLDVSWTPSGSADDMEWSIEGECIETARGDIPSDSGTVTIPANTIRKRTNMQQVPDSCDATLNVSRKRDGVIDRGYGKGGTIYGIQRRKVVFTSAP